MKKIVLALAIALTATSALAVDLNVSASIGRSAVDGENGDAVRVAVSHDYNKHLSSQVSFMNAGNYGGVTTRAIDIVAAGRFSPFMESVALTGRLGMSHTTASDLGASDSAWTPTYGVGVEYAISKEFAANVSFDRYHDFADGGEALDVTMVGATYKF